MVHAATTEKIINRIAAGPRIAAVMKINDFCFLFMLAPILKKWSHISMANKVLRVLSIATVAVVC